MPPRDEASSTHVAMNRDIRRRPLRLRLYPDSVLRDIASPVTRCDQHLDALAEDMLALMRRHDGIGLAAPQVGLSLRLIVVDIGNGPLAVANPHLRPVVDDTDQRIEGCLSLPGVHAELTRRLRIELRGRSPGGKRLHMEAHGLLARVIQHEVDHLEGVLICDYGPACESGIVRSTEGS